MLPAPFFNNTAAWFRRHWLPLTLAALYAVIFSALSILRHQTFHTQTWDLGIFEQSFWNTLRGQVMFNNFENANHLSVHFSPFLFLLVPLYALIPGPHVLLVVHALALGSAVIPLYRIALALVDRRAALLIAAMYLLLPSLHRLNLFDFHEVAFAIPAFLWALERITAGRRFGAAIALGIAASTAENMILAVTGVGLYLLLQPKWRGFGATVAAASLGYFVLVSLVLMPALGGKIYRFDRYASLGGSPTAIARTIITKPNLVGKTIMQPEKIEYLGRLLAQTAGLPLLVPAAWILLLPGLAQNLLTDYSPQFTNTYQYDAILIPFLMFAVALGWQRLARRIPQKIPIIRWTVLGVIAAAVIWWSPLGLRAYPWTQFRFDARANALAKIRDAIPPDAKVAAATNLVPHLTHRDGIWMLGFEPPQSADLVVIDLWDTTGFASNEQFGAYLARYVKDQQYRSRLVAQRFLLLTKKAEISN